MKQKINNYFSGNYITFYSKYLSNIQKASRDEFKSICPFHEDSKPSLCFNNKTGKFHCFGCGKEGDLFHFYAKLNGLNIRHDFRKILKGIAADFGISIERNKSEMIAAYDYVDEKGDLVFQVCRFEPKDFRQRRPNGKGGFIWNLRGVEPVLYRLPEVVKAQEVLIVEGEQDADALANLGFCPTTCAMGAKKWRDNYNRYLEGKHIVLIPDNDNPGREHMDLIGNSLSGSVASLKLLELPNLPNKGDASDFIAKLNGDKEAAAERFAILIETASPYNPPKKCSIEEAKTLRFEFIHNSIILANLQPIQWRIRDILVESSLYYDFGDPGSFKTFLALDRLLCIAAGIDYHGHPVCQGTVFYIAGEGQQGIGRRIAAWHIAHKTKAANIPFFLAKTPTQLMDPGAVDEVRKAVDISVLYLRPGVMQPA